jgi:uncharacterized protein (DUF849 family)
MKTRYHDDVDPKIAKCEDIIRDYSDGGTWAEFFVPKGVKIPALSKPLIITNGITGFFVTKRENPNQPLSKDEIVNAAVESYKEGASFAHIHLKHPEDGTPCVDPKSHIEVMDRIWESAPDMLIALCPLADLSATRFIDVIRPLIDGIVEYGPQYGHTVMTHADSMDLPQGQNITVVPRTLEEVTRYLEEVNLKTEFECWTINGPLKVRDVVMKQNLCRKPYMIDINFGKEVSTYSDVPPYWDFEQFIDWFKIVPTTDTIRGVWVGGRNWLPLVTLAIAMGAELVGVGCEDAIYKYPHKDDLIDKNAEVVKTVATIAKALGREVATPKQARQILRLDLYGK